MEHTLQCIVAIDIKAPRDLCAGHETIEAVEAAWIHMELGWDTGRQQTLSISNVLVQEQVEVAHRNIRRRQARQVSRSSGSGIGRHVYPAGLTAKVGSPTHPVIFPGPHKGIWDCLTGGSDVAVVDHGIDEQLKSHLHFSPGPGQQCEASPQSTPRTR